MCSSQRDCTHLRPIGPTAAIMMKLCS
uniref:Uncharacterized protein n=1 Tax=Anguilla anguilla TaxID=7936 RepID=A0A0E9UWI1_ANGAN